MAIDSRNKPGWHRLSCYLGFLILTVAGCASTPAPPPQTPIITHYNQVALLPFANAAAIFEEGSQVRNPLTSKVFTTGAVPDGAPAVLTRILWEQLRAKTTTSLIPPEQSVGERAEMLSETADFRERRMVAELGRRQGADAVLLGTLYRYRERVGLNYAADTPAAVTFDLILLDTASGRVVWWRSFDEVQQALSENLLKIGTFLKDKGRWLTAAQMSSRALEEMTTVLCQP